MASPSYPAPPSSRIRHSQAVNVTAATSGSGGGGGGGGGVTSGGATTTKLVLYTKPGCCLCDGLKEKLDEVMSGATGITLSAALRSLTLETRDVSTNEAWAAAHAMEAGSECVRVLPCTMSKHSGRRFTTGRRLRRVCAGTLAHYEPTFSTARETLA